MRELRTDFVRREAPSAPYVSYLVEKVKEIGSFSNKTKREKPKTMRTPHNIVVLRAAAPTSIHRSAEFCIKTLVWCRTKFNWFRSWTQLTIQCVFASLSGPTIDLRKVLILAKKSIFSDESYFDLGGYLNKQNCRIWGTHNPARIHWKAYASRTNHCLVRIAVQKHDWTILLRKSGSGR